VRNNIRLFSFVASTDIAKSKSIFRNPIKRPWRHTPPQIVRGLPVTIRARIRDTFPGTPGAPRKTVAPCRLGPARRHPLQCGHLVRPRLPTQFGTQARRLERNLSTSSNGGLQEPSVAAFMAFACRVSERLQYTGYHSGGNTTNDQRVTMIHVASTPRLRDIPQLSLASPSGGSV
jgi:hypothetical protein